MRARWMATKAWSAVALITVAAAGLAQAPVEAAGAAATPAAVAASARTLAGLEFMSGCWRSGEGASYFEEIYTRPTPNLMLGLSIYVRDGRAVGHELTRVEVAGDEVRMTPYPDGVASPHAFTLTVLRPGEEAIFEAPEHDYPKRILYRRLPDGSRTARIDGGPQDGEGQQWRFVAAPCPDASGDGGS